ncbi:MAG: phosphoadenylyl-sulfate reductase [Dehalococcoidia bacterium]
MTTETTATEADPRELAAIEEASAVLDRAEPEEILRWAIDRYGQGLTLACSFGGISGMVLMDMVQNLAPSTEVFYLDTDYLFPETYEMVDTAKAKWQTANIVGYRTDVSTEEQARSHGANLWERDPDLCCEIRKVEPNRRALAAKSAWISGLRRDQSADRGSTPAVQWDAKFGLVKVNPLINWDEKKVWAYIFKHSVPYNPLHDRGYPSIGCTNCTKPVKPGEDPRSGRWSGMDKDECGLHTAP